MRADHPHPGSNDSLVFEPEPGAHDLNEREVVTGGFLVPCSNGSEAFQIVEEDFDEIPLSLELPHEGKLAGTFW